MHKFLTINRHSVYLQTLIEIGFQWVVVDNFLGENLNWEGDPLMQNVEFSSWNSELIKKIQNKEFNKLIVHTLSDLWKVRKLSKSTDLVFVIHIALYKNNKIKSLIKWIVLKYLMMVHSVSVVAISDWKKMTWAIASAKIIKTPPLATMPISDDISELRVAVIGNHLDTRSEVDFSVFKKISEKVDITLLGKNSGIKNSIVTNNRAEYLELMKTFHILVFILQRPFEDGYNLGMLEAMQSGMVVVSLKNPSSPIVNGENGFQCETVEEMIEKIKYLQDNKEIFIKMSEKSKKTILENFSKQNFEESWKKILIN